MSIKPNQSTSVLANGTNVAICVAIRGAILAMALSGTAMAGGKDADAQARYHAERAACQTGQSNQDRDTCLKEAKAALDEARKGHLNAAADGYEQNALNRCEALPAGDRVACQRRIRGEGSISGSVEEGGLLRELVVLDEK